MSRLLLLILSGLMKAAAGVAVGSLLGLAMFRSGKGWRSAAATAGLGVALGSTYERARGASLNSNTNTD
jgi:hypothetical protein